MHNATFGRITVLSCFAILGLGCSAVIKGTMNSKLYHDTFHKNIRATVHDLRLKRRWVMQQLNDPKHTRKSTNEWLKKMNNHVLE